MFHSRARDVSALTNREPGFACQEGAVRPGGLIIKTKERMVLSTIGRLELLGLQRVVLPVGQEGD